MSSGTSFLLKIAHPHGGSRPPSNTLFPGPTRVLNPNSVLIGSAIFAGLTTVTDRPTNRPRYHYLVCNNRPHYFLAKNNLTYRYVSSAGLAFSVHIQVQSKRCYNDAWVYCLHYLPVLYSCWCAFLINIPVLYIGWSDVTVICDHVTICILWDNMAYCVKLSGEDLLHYSNKIESVGLRKCLCYHYITKIVVSQ